MGDSIINLVKIMLRTFLLFLLFMVSFLFSPSLFAGGFNSETLKVDGRKRQFVVKKPLFWDKSKKIPLIIGLHGGGSSWKKFNNGTTKHTLDIETKKRNILLILPQAIDNHWNDGRKIFANNPIDDVKFISKLIDYAIKKYNVDASKVYITGMSNGGMMAIRLAIELSDKVKAVAAVSALLNYGIRNQKPKNPVSFLLINGTTDPIMPYAGGEIKTFGFSKPRGKVLSARKTLNYFLDNNVCNTRPIKKHQDKRPFDKTSLDFEIYDKCFASTQVESIQVNDGGHTWPGGKQYLPVGLIGRASREINASKVIVDFFLSAPLN